MKYRNKFVKKSYYCIDDYELEQIIKQEYPELDWFEILLDVENNSNISISTDFVDFTENEKQEIVNMLVHKRQTKKSLALIMQDLTLKGILEPDNYLINVSW